MGRSEYLPEGTGPVLPPEAPVSALREAMERGQVVEGRAVRCDGEGRLHVALGPYEGIIPRSEAVHPKISGADRDIAVLSRVGRRVSCVVTDIETDSAGKPHLLLSRRLAQELAMEYLLEHLTPGKVAPGRVTHLAHFGAFVDLGCGVVSMIPTDRLAQARVDHPAERLSQGQSILALVTGVDRENCRFYLSHKELLGTWAQNAEAFSPGDTVTGIVRAVRDYGVFVELAPNLTGLAEWWPGVAPGDMVTVYIKSIRPLGRKVKLQIIQSLGPADAPPPLHYYITGGWVENWEY